MQRWGITRSELEAMPADVVQHHLWLMAETTDD